MHESVRQKKIKILVIDDNVGILFAIKQALLLKEYDVVTSESFEGVDAVAAIMPELIFLDISLVGQDGREVSQELKRNDRTKHMKIVILTAYPNADELALEAGADGFLSKPFELAQLWNITDTFTQRPLQPVL